MADELTDNYNLFLPKETDSMRDVKKNLTDNFKKMAARADITVISEAATSLPQSGNYQIGDRVFKQGTVGTYRYPSIYILTVKDQYWGWHWRPVYSKLSPWVTVPATVMNPAYVDAFSPSTTYPWQIALDVRGWCYWRGAVRKITPGLTPNMTFNVLRPLPIGLRPYSGFTGIQAVHPVDEASNTVRAVHFFMSPDGSSIVTGNNTVAGVTSIFWDGLRYQVANSAYYNA